MSVVIFFSASQLLLPVDYLNEHSCGNRWNGLFLSTRQKEINAVVLGVTNALTQMLSS